jgi:TonB family protein
MSSYTNNGGKPEQFDLSVKKFRSLFDMHGVQFGSPQDFPGFMTKLIQDRHFAMDFWAFTGTLSKREGGELSVEQMLAVIVDAVIGGEVPAGDDGIKILVDELATLLAGVDLYSPSRLTEEETVVPPQTPVPSQTAPITHAVSQAMSGNSRDATIRPTGEVPLNSSVPASFVPVSAVESVTAQSSSVATVQHQLDEALMRLELNSLELKEHLEDLDKKMSRIEPHLEALTSKVNSTERLRTPAEEAVDKAFEKSVRKSAENPRLVLEPREEPVSHRHDGPSIPTPLAGYSQRSGHGGIVVFAIILLLVVGGAFALQQRYDSSLWQRSGVVLRDRYDALLKKVHDTESGQAAPNLAAQTSNTVAGSSPAVATVSDAGNSVSMPSTSNASVSDTPASSTPTPTTQTATATSSRSQPVDIPSNPRSNRKATHPASAEPVETIAPDRPLSSSEEASAVKVAPAVMEANLVASRVPVYPEAVKAAHIEGPVVAQAIISKDGFVDHVHIIEGNPRLRNAAAEAIYKWRYRPYLLNGQPVEVATTVTVDFKLDR